MLTIELKINGTVIGTATAANVSNLADVSDYVVVWSELANEDTGVSERANTFRISGHNRRQSAWALVEKIASRAARGKDILGGK